MSLNKKVLAVAIFGALVSGNAFAANLSAPGGAIPAYFAKEIIATVAAPVQLTTTASAATQLSWDAGYNFSLGEVRYARLECSSNLLFDTATTATSSAPALTLGAINGLGTNVLTFSVTATANGTATFTAVGDHSITGTDTNVTCTAALYDQPSQAAAGGAIGRINTSVATGAYLSFVNSYAFTTDVANTATADVEAVPAFTSFLPDAVATLSTADLSELSFDLVDPDGAGTQNAPFRIDGTEITLADLLDTDTNITVAGDFSPAANAAAPLYTGAALTRVVLNGFDADALSATSARFDVGNTAFGGALFTLERRTGNVIFAADYTATLNAVAADPTVYSVYNIGTRDAGHIVRNGTELQAPLAQVPGGWLSRMALTNTGNTARSYTIKVLSETGNTLGTANLSGTVPASGTIVVDLNTVLTSFTTAPRGTLVVNVAGPDGQIQGLYQIVNPTSGSISNHVMVRPGTN